MDVVIEQRGSHHAMHYAGHAITVQTGAIPSQWLLIHNERERFALRVSLHFKAKLSRFKNVDR